MDHTRFYSVETLKRRQKILREPGPNLKTDLILLTFFSLLLFRIISKTPLDLLKLD